MNWLQILQLIIAVEDAELPIIQGILQGIQGTSTAKQQVLNQAVGMALKAPATPVVK